MDTFTTPSTTPGTTPRTPEVSRWARWLPLAGVGYAVLQIAGNLTIGEFPDEGTGTSGLRAFYAQHHAQVGLGGRVLEVSAIFLALFGAALCARTWRSAPVVAAVVGVGTAMAAVVDAASGATYNLLGDIGADSHVSPQALQAWHVGGAAYGSSAGVVVLMLGLAAASVATAEVPPWLGWSGLVLALAQLTPVGFFASLLFLLWALVAGIVLAVRRPGRRPIG